MYNCIECFVIVKLDEIKKEQLIQQSTHKFAKLEIVIFLMQNVKGRPFFR